MSVRRVRSAKPTVVDDGIDGLTILIPHAPDRRFTWMHIVAAAAYLLIILDMSRRPPAGSMSENLITTLFVAMFATWILCAALILGFYLWMFEACDEVTVTTGQLILQRKLGSWCKTLTFELAQVHGLRIDPLIPSRFRIYHPRDLGIGGVLAFDYGGKTRRFGLDLSDDDARWLFELIRPYCKESGLVIRS
jgi:hypothetical protein